MASLETCKKCGINIRPNPERLCWACRKERQDSIDKANGYTEVKFKK